MEALNERFNGETAWKLYPYAAALAVPAFVITTLVGSTLKTDAFFQGVKNGGILGVGIAGVLTGYGSVELQRNKANASLAGAYTFAAFALIDGSLYLAGSLIGGRSAFAIAALNGAASVGTLVGAPLGALFVVGAQTTPAPTTGQ